jgi:hypothetical protein
MKIAPIVIVLLVLTAAIVAYSWKKPSTQAFLYSTLSPSPSVSTTPQTNGFASEPTVTIFQKLDSFLVHGTVVTFEYPKNWEEITSPIPKTFLVRPVGNNNILLQINDFVDTTATHTPELLAKHSVVAPYSLQKQSRLAIGGHQAIKQVLKSDTGERVEAFIKDVRQNDPNDPSHIISGVQHIFMDVANASQAATLENSFDLIISTFRYTY